MDDRPQQCMLLGPMMQPDDAARMVDAGMCPSLYLAVYRGRTEEVMALLLQQHGAATGCQATGIIQHGQCDILEVTAESNTVLHVAAEQGHDELIRDLYLRFREKKGLLSRRNSALDTPLHCAARAGRAGAVAVLVQLAQDCRESILGCKNEAGDTALHLAARYGHGTSVEVLASASAVPAAERNNAGVSPLYLAVMSGSVQAVRAITRSQDASSAGPTSQNALHAAVFRSLEMVRLLLDWKPTLAEQADCSGSSPLHFAASDGDRAIVQAILGAAPRTLYKKDSGGLSALHVAARMGHRRVVEDMLRSCPDAAELRDDGGGTFLHAAARERRSSPVVSLAVKSPMLRGLLDAQDRGGNTPLHLAVAAGAPGVAEALLRMGKVRADVLNNDGHTPFDLAAKSTSFSAMVSLVVSLVAFGAPLRPQRQDQLKLWSGGEVVQGLQKTSDSLAVVAVLIATVAFAAGFNVPGGYSDTTGEANLSGKLAFKSFLLLDTIAVSTSVIAVILLVYRKATRSAGSWKSFLASVQCISMSLISLMMAFYLAMVAVATTKAVYRYGFWVIYACILALNTFITWWVGPATTLCSIWTFLWQHRRLNGRQAIKRQYPLVLASVLNLCLFLVTGMLAPAAFVVISGLPKGIGKSPAPSPAPL